MGARKIFKSAHVRRTMLASTIIVCAGATVSTAAGASNRVALVAASTNSDGIVLIALGGGVLLLGVIGFVLFTWSRRKRRPTQCAEEREALALAEKAVQYWEVARAHLEAVERGRSKAASASDDSSHASLVANAVDGLREAIKQRDQCQMNLIHCMASGVPAMPVVAPPPVQPQPFFIPGPDESSPSHPRDGLTN
jgi:hypothetical protein